jgi:hypothetical protein
MFDELLDAFLEATVDPDESANIAKLDAVRERG